MALQFRTKRTLSPLDPEVQPSSRTMSTWTKCRTSTGKESRNASSTPKEQVRAKKLQIPLPTEQFFENFSSLLRSKPTYEFVHSCMTTLSKDFEKFEKFAKIPVLKIAMRSGFDQPKKNFTRFSRNFVHAIVHSRLRIPQRRFARC